MVGSRGGGGLGCGGSCPGVVGSKGLWGSGVVGV